MVEWLEIGTSIVIILLSIFVFGFVKLFIFFAPISKLIGAAIDGLLNQLTGGIGGAISMAGGGQAVEGSGKMEFGSMCCGMVGEWVQPLGVLFFMVTGWIILLTDMNTFGLIFAIVMTIAGLVGVLLRKMPIMPPPEISFPLIDIPMMTREYNSFWAIVACAFFDLTLLASYPISAGIGFVLGWLVFIALLIGIIVLLVYTSEFWAPVAAEMLPEMAGVGEMAELGELGEIAEMGEMGEMGEMDEISNAMRKANDISGAVQSAQPQKEAAGAAPAAGTAAAPAAGATTAQPSPEAAAIETEIEGEEEEIKEEEAEEENELRALEAKEEAIAAQPVEPGDEAAAASKQKQLAAIGNLIGQVQGNYKEDIDSKRAEAAEARKQKASLSSGKGGKRFGKDKSGATSLPIILAATLGVFVIVFLFVLAFTTNLTIGIVFAVLFGLGTFLIMRNKHLPDRKKILSIALLLIILSIFMLVYRGNSSVQTGVNGLFLQQIPSIFSSLKDTILSLFWDLVAMVIPQNIGGVPVQNPMQFQSCYPFCTSPTGEPTIWSGLEITNMGLIPAVVYDYQTFSLLVEFTNLGAVDAEFIPPTSPTLKSIEVCEVDVSTGALIQTILGDADAVLSCKEESILSASGGISEYVAGGCREEIWDESTESIIPNAVCKLEPQDTLRVVWYGIDINEDNPALDLGLTQTPEIEIEIPYSYKPNTDLVGYMVVSSLETQVASQEMGQVERISNKISESYSPVGPLMMAMGTAEQQVIEHIPTLFMLQFANKGIGTVQDVEGGYAVPNVGIPRDNIRVYMPPNFEIMGYSATSMTSKTCDFSLEGTVSELKTDPSWHQTWYPGPGFDDYYVLKPKQSLLPIVQSFNPFENPVFSCVLYPPSEEALQELNTYMFKTRVSDYGYVEKRSVFVQVIGTDVVVEAEVGTGCMDGSVGGCISPTTRGGCIDDGSVDWTYTYYCDAPVSEECTANNVGVTRGGGAYGCVEDHGRYIWEAGKTRTNQYWDDGDGYADDIPAGTYSMACNNNDDCVSTRQPLSMNSEPQCIPSGTVFAGGDGNNNAWLCYDGKLDFCDAASNGMTWGSNWRCNGPEEGIGEWVSLDTAPISPLYYCCSPQSGNSPITTDSRWVKFDGGTSVCPEGMNGRQAWECEQVTTGHPECSELGTGPGFGLGSVFCLDKNNAGWCVSNPPSAGCILPVRDCATPCPTWWCCFDGDCIKWSTTRDDPNGNSWLCDRGQLYKCDEQAQGQTHGSSVCSYVSAGGPAYYTWVYSGTPESWGGDCTWPEYPYTTIPAGSRYPDDYYGNWLCYQGQLFECTSAIEGDIILPGLENQYQCMYNEESGTGWWHPFGWWPEN